MKTFAAACLKTLLKNALQYMVPSSVTEKSQQTELKKQTNKQTNKTTLNVEK